MLFGWIADSNQHSRYSATPPIEHPGSSIMSEERVPQPSVSFARVLTVVIPIALIAAGAYVWSRNLEPTARKELADASFSRILSSNSITPAASKFEDKDGDLVADSPDDPKQ